ncbi:hypothetical protein B6U99_06075 [Candidatus Geothermarchaeota archaeon ex4572_27]|nr:MAG: hypothetical protein B6U99_06075 [Candidatus Geothermarchaeota archaeon ex4572_27]
MALQRVVSMCLSLVLFPIMGLLFDRYGRRRFLVMAYTILGLEYALISVDEGAIVLYVVSESMAWSVLSLFFIYVVWSDISPPELRAPFYSLGLVPVFIGRISEYIVSALGLVFTRYQIYPIVSALMFVMAALFMLMPETLPQSHIERRRMVEYIRKAKRLRERRGA